MVVHQRLLVTVTTLVLLTSSAAAHAGVTAPALVSLGQTSSFESARRSASVAGAARQLLQNSSSSGNAAAAPAETASSTFSNATIHQDADVTLRLVGSDALPFTNLTLTVLQHSLQEVFRNYSSTSFQYQSAMVSGLLLVSTCACQPAHRVSSLQLA